MEIAIKENKYRCRSKESSPGATLTSFNGNGLVARPIVLVPVSRLWEPGAKMSLRSGRDCYFSSSGNCAH